MLGEKVAALRKSLANATLVVVVSVASSLVPSAVGGVPAFPGAEGFGSDSVGGRGGRVLYVVNLYDSGPGSLRAALEAEGSRTVVFQVGGTIVLKSGLAIRNPFITVAGQTAPGEGITLRNAANNDDAAIRVLTHDVIIRFIRVRPGASTSNSGSLDAIRIGGRSADTHNVVIDHCSFSWATDENVSFAGSARDISFQWNFVTEGLDCSSHAEEGKRKCHSKGMLISDESLGSITLHHNLFAHNRERNPAVYTPGVVDIVNNVVFNPGFGGQGLGMPAYVVGKGFTASVNFVGNYFKAGSDTGAADWYVATHGVVRLYAEGNHVDKNLLRPSSKDAANRWRWRHPAPELTTSTPEDAYRAVLSQGGANLGLNCNGTLFTRPDDVDRRIISEVEGSTGRIIDTPLEVGGWPKLSGGKPCVDDDRDGIPNEWERLRGLNPTDGRDASEPSASGYTWLEEYLNFADVRFDSNVIRSQRSRQHAPRTKPR